MPNSSQKTRKRITAQAMVEFALALPVLLLVVYGLLETGRLLFMYASVVTAARQAARYGSATGDNGSGTKYYDDCAGITASAKRLEFIQRFSNISITFDHPGSSWHWDGCPINYANSYNNGHPANGDRIRVSVSSLFSPIVPLVPLRPFTITSTSNRTLLVGSYIAVEHPSEGFIGSGTQGFVLTKWANTDYYYHVGDTITYHYTIQNTGTTPIDGPFWILDNRISTGNPKGFPCTGAPSPLPGPSGVVTCPDQVYTITAADITSPEVTNHARASNDGGSVYSNEAVYTVSFVPQPHITLTKVGEPPDVVQSGATVSYTFTIVNDGNMPLKAPYAIQDSLLGKNWSCPSTPDPLPVGGAVVCTGSFTLRNTDINAQAITNTATATAMNGTSTVTSASVTVNTPVPLLQLTNWTVNVNPYTSLGQTLTFTYYFWNRGTTTLTNLGINSTKAGTVTCPTSVAAGGKDHCTMTYVIAQTDLDAGTLLDTVTMHGDESKHQTWTSNALAVSVPGTQVGAVAITETPAPAGPPSGSSSLAVGQVIAYSFTFQNSGNITLKGPYTIAVDDVRLGTIICVGPATLPVGAPAGSVTCPTKNIALTQADIDAGRLITHATGTAFPSIGTALVTPGTATATVITYTLPRLALVKTPNKTTFIGLGDTITYTYGLKNTGGVEDVAVTPFTLKDDKLVQLINCPAGTIAVGATLSCGSLNYTPTDTDVANLYVKNTLTVDTSNTGSGTGVTSGQPAPVVNSGLQVTVPLLKCDSSTLYSSTISDGTSVYWNITNKTGIDLHITGGWMRWNNPVLLQSINFGGTPMSVTGASTLLLPGAGWPKLPYSLDTPTVVNFKFSGTASGIQVYLTFQETFGGLTCTLQSP